MNKNAVLDRYYLDCRCMLLELAATLDRYDRAPVSPGGSKPIDERRSRLGQAIAVLAQPGAQADRAQRILHLLSDSAV
ncbi:MAG: hypothetical protein ACP5I8_10555 [Phycisphaerae bacterium]